MANPLEKAVRSAIRANEQIGKLNDRLGSADRPSGVVLAAYRNANRAMRSALTEQAPLLAAREVMNQLRATLHSGVGQVLRDAAEFGRDEAIRQLGFYGAKPAPDQTISISLSQQADAALAAVLANVDAQQAAIEALLIAGAQDDAMIVGDASRTGILRPSNVLPSANYWTAALVADLFSGTVSGSPTLAQAGQPRWKKQVIAALDMHTTDCCLQAHGQVQPLDHPFHLTGTPRFADNLDWTPFHWGCRSSVAIYLDIYDDGLTEWMRNSADYVLSQREAGKDFNQHPADAFVEGF
jgi:hypothetical protein